MSDKIRKAIPTDLPRIIALVEELSNKKINLSPEEKKKVFNEITAMPSSALLVAEVNGYVAGTVYLQIVPSLVHNGRPWGILEHMVVDKKYQRQGLGRKLIEAAVKICREANCYKVGLSSSKFRKEAHEFYRTMGFEESALSFRMYLD